VFSPTRVGQADQSLDQIPVPVQGINAKNLENSNALDLADLMNKRLTSVFINENVGNPYQPDINYRGYTASPLLGTPEGLSVYLDGVRQNQPFGDVVAWNLIPKIAIRDMALIPGSDPVYGLNTLGGVVSVQTKDGLTTPQITGGKFGRRGGEGEIGGVLHDGFNYYEAGNLYREASREAAKQRSRESRVAVYDTAMDLIRGGLPQPEVARRLSIDSRTIRRWVESNGFPEQSPRCRKSSLDRYREYLDQRWQQGCHNAAQLWRELR
jgi:outer membrane receptor protein involved in Fe transport